jgi:hypothetical protein
MITCYCVDVFGKIQSVFPFLDRRKHNFLSHPYLQILGILHSRIYLTLSSEKTNCAQIKITGTTLLVTAFSASDRFKNDQ